MTTNNIESVRKLLRYYILTSTTKAGSGHVTSSLSAVEIMATLFYKYFRFDLENPDNINNDRLIFSKGHASPLFYALYGGAGKLTEKEMLNLRQFDSVLEGHPTKRFKYTEVPTGSLGQGLSVGVGMALSAKMDKLDFLTYVLLGDGEMAEGQIWEALEIASHYKLNNLVGIIDVNRLGQAGQTLLGHDLITLEDRIKSFGWRTYVISDGHNLEDVNKAYEFVLSELPKADTPYMILAKTIKGKGVSFLEGKVEWHGRSLDEEQLTEALDELGSVDKTIRAEVRKTERVNSKLEILNPKQSSNNNITNSKQKSFSIPHTPYPVPHIGDSVATREAYGQALVELGKMYEDIVVMDGDMGNSTFSYKFKEKFPERYFEMFIAEQNMVSVALGMSERGKLPFISTFASFWTRALDQIRMLHYSGNHISIIGSHYGVSIGQDGPSQMGLEDISMFRTLSNTTVFCPSDGVSCYKITALMYQDDGLNYMRINKMKVPVIYNSNEDFRVGGSKTLKSSKEDKLTVISCGDCVHETLKAHKELAKSGVNIRVIDAYSIKPIDKETILKAVKETKAIITVEDHYITGGLGDAVLEVLAEVKNVPVYKLGVTKIPKSGKPEELLEYGGISAGSIIDKVKSII